MSASKDCLFQSAFAVAHRVWSRTRRQHQLEHFFRSVRSLVAMETVYQALALVQEHRSLRKAWHG